VRGNLFPRHKHHSVGTDGKVRDMKTRNSAKTKSSTSNFRPITKGEEALRWPNPEICFTLARSVAIFVWNIWKRGDYWQ
jgi:hypothetical protein